MTKQDIGQGGPNPEQDTDHRGHDAKDDFVDGQTDWEYLVSMSGEDAYRHALADEDNPPLTRQQLARMRRAPNPKAIRARLQLTQKEFARRFQISLGALRAWEQGLHLPDSAATAYLRVIEQSPDAVAQALRMSVPGSSRSSSKPDDIPKFNASGAAWIGDQPPARWRTDAPATTTTCMEANVEERQENDPMARRNWRSDRRPPESRAADPRG